MLFATTKNINKTSFFVARGAVFIIALFYNFVQKCVNETIDEEMKKEQPKTGKSKFQQRLYQVMEQQKQAKEQ